MAEKPRRLACVLLLITLALSSSSAVAAPGIERQLRDDLKSRHGSDFENLAVGWKRRFGSGAAAVLMKIAQDRRSEDHQRYIALMSAARLGGKTLAPEIVLLLKDPSWMLRSASLRTLAALNATGEGAAALPLLKDTALVVRAEAVDTILRLRPAGSVEALLEALESPQNFHHGKSQWVPQKALLALIEMKAPAEIAPRLLPVLKNDADPDLQKTAIFALEQLTGKRLKPKATLSEKIRAWNTQHPRSP